MRNAWAQFQQQQAAQQQKAQAPQSIFDQPEQYLIENVINPLRQEMRLEVMDRNDKMSRYYANREHGQQAVEAALADLKSIRDTPQGGFIYQQIMQSGHPYGELVAWHNEARQQHQMRQQMGNNPQAWMQQQEERWFEDPQKQLEMLKRLRAKQVKQQQQQRGARQCLAAAEPVVDAGQ